MGNDNLERNLKSSPRKCSRLCTFKSLNKLLHSHRGYLCSFGVDYISQNFGQVDFLLSLRTHPRTQCPRGWHRSLINVEFNSLCRITLISLLMRRETESSHISYIPDWRGFQTTYCRAQSNCPSKRDVQSDKFKVSVAEIDKNSGFLRRKIVRKKSVAPGHTQKWAKLLW